MKRIGLFLLMWCASLSLQAQVSEVCEKVIGSTDDRALLTIETDSQDRVVVSISAGDGGAEALTTFRAKGLDPAGWKFDGQPLAQYFTQSPASAANQKQVLLTPVHADSVAGMKGRKITFNRHGENVYCEWKTSQNTNAYSQSVSFSYTYGATCRQLDAPLITQIDASKHISFGAVTDATSYTVRVYLGTVLKYQQTVQPGGVVNFTPYQSGTYSVTLTASAPGCKTSPASAPYAWTLTAAPVQVGNSEYCSYTMGTGNSMAYVTWNTLANGDVEIAISGDAGTSFRANGFGASLSAFQVGNGPASAYFSKQYAAGDDTYVLHLNDANQRPAQGEKIRFSGTVEWRTAQNTNAYGTLSFTYTYGSVCPSLEAPVIDSIGVNKALYLSNLDANAGKYHVYVYRGELLVYSADVQNEQVIDFTPSVSYTYTVYVQALPARAGSEASPLSDAYMWQVRGTEADLELSTVCDKYVSSDDGGVYLTAETDDDGQIVFTLRGKANPVWRAAGLDLNALTLGGGSVGAYFRTASAFVGDSVMVLQPTSAGTGVFFPGDEFRFNGTIEWQVKDAAGQNISRWSTTFQFAYVYGSTCTPLMPRLETPRALSVSAPGEVQFWTVDDAASYEVKVLDEESDEMVRQTAFAGYVINREQAIYNPFTYYVSVRALPAADAPFRPSYWSDVARWQPDYQELPNDEEEEDPEYTRLQEQEARKARKVLRDGQLYIVRDGVEYTIVGTRAN